MSLKPCSHCQSNNLHRFTLLDKNLVATEDKDAIECLDCGAIAPESIWNNRPGEATARLTAFEEGEQWTIAFIQSHFYDRPDEIECLEKDVANAFQILKEKP